jgi:hypothetical protein
MRIGMSWAELLLLILTGWTLVGFLGVTLSYLRQERRQARRHLIWIGGIWLLYIAVLLTISVTAKPRSIARDQEQCFGTRCLAVVRTEMMPGYLASHGEQLLRVSVRITNHSRKDREGDTRLKAYLLDSQNRRWYEIPGLQGVRLSTIVAPGNSIVSQPIFKVASDATGLRFVLTHGRELPYALLLGDRDSLLHASVSVPLQQ